MSEEVKEEKMGVKESKDMLALAFSLGKVIKEAKANDGKVDAKDLMLLMQIIPTLGPAIEGMDKIPAEIKDIDVEEAKELLVYAGEQVGEMFSEEELVKKINAGLEVGLSVAKLIAVL